MRRKPSTKARTLRSRMQLASTQKERISLALSDPFANHELVEAEAPAWHRALLGDLVNLSEASIDFFRKKWSSAASENNLLGLRDDLRKLWRESDPGVVQIIVKAWVLSDLQSGGEFPWSPSVRFKRWVPNQFHFRGSLSAGVLEWFELFRYCANPNCSFPYFIANRRDQKYCELGECTRYAQKLYAAANYQKKKARQQEMDKKKGVRRNGAHKKK